ncbi:MAG: tetratricopeptide repeat protein, partial [Bryobacteraceae bacterium]|nr:tetratricopeptide repeat protein [Bryobacteraceae bacterium]
RVRFTLELIDPAGPRQLAAKQFEYDGRNPAVGRQRALDELARLFEVREETARRTAVASGVGAAPDAYGAYLKGRGLLARYDVPANLEQAIRELERAVMLDPKFALAHAALAEACWRKSRAAGDAKLAGEAIAHGQRAVELDPELPTARTTLAAIYTMSGRESEAIRELERAQQLAPGSAEATRELARVYTQLGRMNEAEAAYRKAIAARPTDWYGFLLLGLHYYQNLERYDDAIKAFEQARQLTPDNELIYRNLGVVYLLQGKYDRSVEELRQSLKLKVNATTYGSLASAYYLQHRYADAVAAIETAIDLDPKRYYFWGNLGNYCVWNPGSEGRAPAAFRKAIELGEKFLAVSPNDYDVRANLAHYYARVGNKAKALAEVEKIPDAARRARINRIAAVYELTGNRAQAIPMLVATLKNPATWHQIQDDPDLAALWRDARLQAALKAAR